MGHRGRAHARVLPAGPRLLIVGVDGRELSGRPTGTGRYLRNLLRAWSRAGAANVLVYFDGPPPDDRVLALPGIVPRPLGEGGHRGIWWSERIVPPAARQDEIDVFFAPAYTCPLSLDRPRVTVVHDVSFFALPHDFGLLDGFRRRATVAASMRASRFVITVSDFSRREIEGLFPDVRGRVHHIPLGRDDDLPPSPGRDTARAALGLEGPMVLTVGAILNRRPLPALLRASGRIRHRWPGLTVHVVGENRTDPALDIEQAVEDSGMAGHVSLAGYVGDEALAVRYAAADVAVFLSDYEGFGLPALEAMARGIPVIVSRPPAMGEIFGEAAVVVEARDEQQIADAIDSVLLDRDLRADLVRRGYALASRYSWPETAARTWQCLVTAAAP